MPDPKIYTIGWICAITTEFTAAKVMLDETHPSVGSIPARDTNSYALGRVGCHNVVLAVLPKSQVGLVSAANVATNMLNTFPNIRVGLLVGIGGGAPTSRKDIRLGDVVVSAAERGTGGVFQYDYGRTVQNQKFEITGLLNQPPTALATAISDLESEHEIEGHHISETIHQVLQRYPRLRKKYSRPPKSHDRLYISKITHPESDYQTCNVACGDGSEDEPILVNRLERSEDDDNPEIHYGIIASANQLMKDASIRDKLASDHGVACFEMEAAGLMNNFPCVVIRGICDYADTHKNDEWQGYAAMTAASYAKELLNQLSNTRLEEEKRIGEILGSVQLSLTTIDSKLEGQDEILDEINNRTERHQHREAIDRLPYVKEAIFDSHDEDQNPTCLENTRVDLLAQVSNWIETGDQKTVFWLNGMAGTGKSTISRTVARSLSNVGTLGASFFFKRGATDRASTIKLCGTIARQLAVNHPYIGRTLHKAIEEDPEIGSKGLRMQFEKLILSPLSSIPHIQPSTVAIVLDALDECNSERDIKLIISLFSEFRNLHNIRPRIFLTSRPELPVRLGFSKVIGTYQDFILHEIPPPVIKHDISVFFQHEFMAILMDWNDSVAESRKLPMAWPGEENIQALVERTVPLFIFATTICRFISDRHKSPKERLRQVLEHPAWSAVDRMRATYAPVLDQLLFGLSAVEKNEFILDFQLIVGTIITLESPLSAGALSRLLDVSQEKVNDSLDKLHSVLNIPESSDVPIRLFHLSFRDYLIDKEVTTEDKLRIDEKEASRQLLASCMRVMKAHLKPDICDVRDPSTDRATISSTLINKSLPADLQYACVYWVQHQKAAGLKESDVSEIESFFKKYLLHWIEALILLDRKWDISRILKALHSVIKHDSVLFDFLVDARRLLSSSIDVIDSYPLQLYSHALVFSPQNSIIKATFENLVPKWIKSLPATEPAWDSSLHVRKLEPLANGSGRCTISFVPETTLLFISRDLGYFDIVDWDTGECLQEFRNTLESGYYSVLSPNGKVIATPSSKHHIQIREFSTSQLLYELSGSCERWAKLSFSGDSQLLAVHGENNIYIWDWAAGICVHKLPKGPSTNLQPWCSTFSADSAYLLSSNGCETSVWDCQTGHPVFEQSFAYRVEGFHMFSPDGKIFIFLSRKWELEIWSCHGFKRLRRLAYQGSSFEHICNLLISPDSKLLAVVLEDMIQLWSLAEGQHVSDLKRVCTAHIAFSPDSKYLVSGGGTDLIDIWCMSTSAKVNALRGHGKGKGLGFIAFSSDGTVIATQCRNGDDIRVWDWERVITQLVAGVTLNTESEDQHLITKLKPSHDLQKIAAFTRDKMLVYSISSGTLLWQPAFSFPKSLDPWEMYDDTGHFSTDSTLITLAFRRSLTPSFSIPGISIPGISISSVSILEASSGTPVWEMRRKGQNIKTTLSDDSQLLVVAIQSTKNLLFTRDVAEEVADVSIWQRVGRGFEVMHTLINPGYQAISQLKFSSGAKLVAGIANLPSADQHTRWNDGALLWNLTSPQTQPLLIHGCNFIVAFSDSLLAWFSSGDRRLRIWDIETNECCQILDQAPVVGAFSNDGRLLAIRDHSDVTVLNWRKGLQLTRIHGATSHDSIRRENVFLSFLPSDLGIRTEMGTFNIPKEVLTSTIPILRPLDVFAPTFSVKRNDNLKRLWKTWRIPTWIQWRGRNVLLLPQEYDLGHVIIAGSQIVTTLGSEKLTSIEFLEEKLLELEFN